jgi:hypothetical protein
MNNGTRLCLEFEQRLVAYVAQNPGTGAALAAWALDAPCGVAGRQVHPCAAPPL